MLMEVYCLLVRMQFSSEFNPNSPCLQAYLDSPGRQLDRDMKKLVRRAHHLQNMYMEYFHDNEVSSSGNYKSTLTYI